MTGFVSSIQIENTTIDSVISEEGPIHILFVNFVDINLGEISDQSSSSIEITKLK